VLPVGQHKFDPLFHSGINESGIAQTTAALARLADKHVLRTTLGALNLTAPGYFEALARSAVAFHLRHGRLLSSSGDGMQAIGSSLLPPGGQLLTEVVGFVKDGPRAEMEILRSSGVGGSSHRPDCF